MTWFWIWLSIAAALTVGEILTLAFFAAFLALGALIAALAAALGVNLFGDVVVFALVSLGGIVFARPLLFRTLRIRRRGTLRSGAEAMIGERCQLADPILGPASPGHVRIAGELWPAITVNGKALEANTPVVVTGLERATLVVRPLDDRDRPKLTGGG